MVIIVLLLKILGRILNQLNLKLVIKLESLSTKTLLAKVTPKSGQGKCLVLILC